MSNKTVIAVVGPTAIGKTKMAITLARHFNAEILSADSRQFFKEMEIGTAVPSKEELKQAPHHFIQHKSIHEPYSVGDFERDALELLSKLFQQKDIVILVGGSGLYVDAVLYGLDSFPDVQPEIRAKLNRELEQDGIGGLQQQLKKLDPTYYDKVDLENPHRIIRALEVCISSGKPYSSFLNQPKNKRPFNHLIVGIDADRQLIYDRINQRVDLMMKAGLLDEAKNIYFYQNLNALQTVGYRELFEYFSGKRDLASAIEEIKKNTRRFAKRQLTWYRKNKSIHWVPFSIEKTTLIKQVENKLTQMEIPKIIYVMGVSGTGKSTIGKLLSEQLGFPYFDGDDYHPEANVTKMASGTALNDDDRQGWLEKLNTLALENLNTGAIIACSALKKKYRETLRKEIAEQTVFIHLTGSFELIKQRLDARKGHFMSAALLQSQFDTLEPPSNEIEVSIAHDPQAICQEILAKLKTWKLP